MYTKVVKYDVIRDGHRLGPLLLTFANSSGVLASSEGVSALDLPNDVFSPEMLHRFQSSETRIVFHAKEHSAYEFNLTTEG